MTDQETKQPQSQENVPTITDPNYRDQDEDATEDKNGVGTQATDIVYDDYERISGIAQEIKAEWKTKYGVVFRIWFLQEQYIYRNFTYYEYKELKKVIREQYKDNLEAGDEAFKEEIQKMCVLWPKDYRQRLETGKPTPIPGGIPYMIGDYILAASGFTDIIPDIISNADNQI